MKVLLVFAHPEERSLNGSLRDVAIKQLESEGHVVKVSDLYAQGWKATLDKSDFLNHPVDQQLRVNKASAAAYSSGELPSDIKEEQEKLLWADFLILQFPLWWYSMPAILKGWIERVFSYGFGYGIGERTDSRYGDRYGEGTFAGKRAMLLITIGAAKEHYSVRGIDGHIDDVLFTINHGVLFYAGFSVLPPFLVYRANRLDEARFEEVSEELRERMRTISTATPIPYRMQNGGDYTIPTLQLKEGLEKPGTTGLSLHTK